MKTANISTNKILLIIGLISTVVLVAAIIWHNLNFSFFIGLLFNDAKEFAEKGTITSNFMPIGYSGFLGMCLKIGGVNGIPACQTLVYIGILLATFWFLKLRGVQGALLALGILVIAFHPVLLLNIWRIHDGDLTALLLLGFLAAGISCMRFGKTWDLIFLSIFVGLLFAVRQNALPLFLIALIFLKNKTEGQSRYLVKAALFLILAFVFMVGVNLVLKQKPIYLGDQGFYNLFSGTNEHASKYLIKDFSGENSLEEALRARGFSSINTFEERLSFPSEIYKKLSLDYIKEHPLDYLKLTALKAYTLFRPGYHKLENSVVNIQEILKQALKIVLAAPFFIWLFFVYKTRENFLKKENLFVFLVVIVYIAPFLVANADPRYRFPLDIIFIADSFYRAKRISTT